MIWVNLAPATSAALLKGPMPLSAATWLGAAQSWTDSVITLP